MIARLPDWVRLVQAARWMKVGPWELMEREDRDFWMEGVALVSNAEHDSVMKKQSK